jgi:hypothetical protein
MIKHEPHLVAVATDTTSATSKGGNQVLHRDERQEIRGADRCEIHRVGEEHNLGLEALR